MTNATAQLPDLRGLADDELAALYNADERAARAVLARCDQLDRLADLAAERERVKAAWRDKVHADYLLADAECRGELLSKEGIKAGISDEHALWAGPLWLAERYASEELRDHWKAHPRVTIGEYMRQYREDKRAARLEALECAAPGPAGDDETGDDPWTDEAAEVTSDEHCTAERGEPAGVGGHEAIGLRRIGAADPVRAGGAGSGPVAAQGGQVRDPGPVQHARGGGELRMPLSYDDARMGPLDRIDLWDKRIPRGDVSLLYGDGAVGKGRMIADLIGRITTGRPMPFCGQDTAGEPGSVIVILPEDDPNEQVAHRLRAAGADLSRVYDLTRLDGGSRFKLSADLKHDGDLPHLRGLVDQLEAAGRNPRLVVIDPLAAVLGWGTISTNPGARRLVEPLQDMAKDTGVAVLVVAHTVKSGVLQGSAGLPQALRTVWKVSRDRDNPAFRVLSLEKANNLPAVEPARYTVQEDESGQIRVIWQDLDAVREQRMSWRERLAERKARITPQAAPRSVVYSAAVGSRGRDERSLGRWPTLAAAREACEKTGEWAWLAANGQALRWVQVPSGNWVAGDPKATAFAVIASQAQAV